MARNFDDFPLYDKIVKSNGMLDDVWVGILSSFMQTLQEYLTQGGIFVPRLTTAERNALQNVKGGQLIYNTSLEKFQGYENGSWQNLI